MTDQPGRPPEERLPAPRPASTPVPAERFSAPPSAHRNDLTPERAAKIVRQSANARWVGFLAVTIVVLFTIGYYFYEIGLPGNPDGSRLAAQANAQQVTSIERGYNIYQANCAQCHGVDGEGGKGPILNRQDKLFDHLNRAYLANILEVGGRYACGNPSSIMPIWSNTGNPPGPLNYKAIEDLINFLRAEKGTEYRILDPELFEPKVDPVTGEELTFEGWVDPAYRPEPGATPYPACWEDEFGQPAASPSAAPSGEPGASEAPAGEVLKISAVNIAFDTKELSAPADTKFQIEFTNNDAGIKHNVEIRDASGKSLFLGEIFPGVDVRTYTVDPLPAGTYTFLCTVHPNMVGTLTVGG
jgi:mono/diheme cytochrome c family protein/plastocyanin